MANRWKNIHEFVELEIGGKHYLIRAVHSGHDYPPVITSDPGTSDPGDFELIVDRLERGECDGSSMPKDELESLLDEYHEMIVEKLINQSN